METLCVMPQYKGWRVLYNQCMTKHVTCITLRAWVFTSVFRETSYPFLQTPALKGEILFVSVVSVAYSVDVVFWALCPMHHISAARHRRCPGLLDQDLLGSVWLERVPFWLCSVGCRGIAPQVPLLASNPQPQLAFKICLFLSLS